MRSILRRDFLALMGGSFFAAATNGIARAIFTGVRGVLNAKVTGQ
jgi:hypothetical protein